MKVYEAFKLAGYPATGINLECFAGCYMWRTDDQVFVEVFDEDKGCLVWAWQDLNEGLQWLDRPGMYLDYLDAAECWDVLPGVITKEFDDPRDDDWWDSRVWS